MKQHILLVEDSDFKRARIRAYLLETVPSASVDEAQSFSGGCKMVEQYVYDIVVMDMSLPTYDRSPSDSGGRFRALGGREIARKIMRRNAQTRIVFLTQYDSFSESAHSHTLKTLDEVLRAECKDSYGGLIYYDSSKSLWKDQLGKALAHK